MFALKLSLKIVLIFSALMLLALLILSSYAANSSIQGARAFTETRFRNMSASIERDLLQDLDMMEMTVRELTENTTFMSALNQLVRDNSDEQEMAYKAGKIAVEQLLQSPLVESFYRVTFYTRDGDFLTTYVDATDRDYTLLPRTDEAIAAISAMAWMDEADKTDKLVILAPHEDAFCVNRKVSVYGIAQRIKYSGEVIGYLEISNLLDELERITSFIDDEGICVELYFDDGESVYQSQPVDWTWPRVLEKDAFITVNTGENSSRVVFSTHINSLGMQLYISQDNTAIEKSNYQLSFAMFLRALYIVLPALALIIAVSIGLTASIRKLTRKMRQLPSDKILRLKNDEFQSLLAPVTSPRDHETREMENAFNQLMIRLREGASNEIALREGTLQAQFNALQTQINPHFIYNTLNIISARSMENGNYDVIEICDQFAQMLRYSTDTRSRTATMAEEIENVRNYLMLAKARYEDNLDFFIDVPENLNSIVVPKLTLQPLVENAMIHGFDGSNVLRRLFLTGQIQDGQLILEIRDNGTGFDDTMLESLRDRIREIEEDKLTVETAGGHIGLINTCLRLHYYSGGQMHMSIRNDNGAVITLTMPCGDDPAGEQTKEK